MYKIRYRIVDAEGDELDMSGFKPFTRILVKMRSVEFQPDGEDSVMIITLEYTTPEQREQVNEDSSSS